MAPEIRELDPTTVERIAAGEVVERPASVVKELVENSLDADASRVRVAVESGGTESIRVSDDGIGMDEQSLRRTVEKHTTSKIRNNDAEGGDVERVRPAGCPEGTTIEVEDLFYNVPARRKYLSQDATEFAHVNSVVTAYALANPDIAFELEHDGRETFATTGQGGLRETVMDVYGREVAQAMIPLEAEAVPEGPLESVSGLVSHPETNRAGREYLSTYVNGRYVTADAVREAVMEAYETQLASDRYPFAVLFVEIDPSDVDVNVHPRKMDIRFADDEGVREQITVAVADALKREGLLRSTAPRGRSAPEQTEINPGEREESSSGSDGLPSTGETTNADATRETQGPAARGDGETAAGHESTRSQSSGEATADSSSASASPRSVGSSASETGASEEGEGVGDDPPVCGRRGSSGSDRDSRQSPSMTATDQQHFGEDDPTVREFGSLPSMRVLGQFQETYVVAETDDGLVLLDQHAADERINYERLRERFLGETTTQVLAEAVEIELTARESALFERFTDALSRLGFQADRIDERTVEVRTVPALLAESGGPELVRDVLSSFVSHERAAAETVDAVADELLADLACYPSVTANTSLTDGSILSLLEALADCDNPYACPHGRPVLIEIDTDEIADRFERDYPGHG